MPEGKPEIVYAIVTQGHADNRFLIVQPKAGGIQFAVGQAFDKN